MARIFTFCRVQPTVLQGNNNTLRCPRPALDGRREESLSVSDDQMPTGPSSYSVWSPVYIVSRSLIRSWSGTVVHFRPSARRFHDGPGQYPSLPTLTGTQCWGVRAFTVILFRRWSPSPFYSSPQPLALPAYSCVRLHGSSLNVRIFFPHDHPRSLIYP